MNDGGVHLWERSRHGGFFRDEPGGDHLRVSAERRDLKTEPLAGYRYRSPRSCPPHQTVPLNSISESVKWRHPQYPSHTVGMKGNKPVWYLAQGSL